MGRARICIFLVFALASLALAACSDDATGRICAVDSDCPSGEVCIEKRCVSISDLDGYDGGADDGGSRPDYGDVGSWDAGGPSPCDFPNDCAFGEECFNGFCVVVTPDPACVDDYQDDCEDDTYCESSLGGCVSWDARPGEVDCEHIPPEGQFTPVEEWAWLQPAEAPEWDEVIMTPVVIDLTGQAGMDNFVVPAVVFNSFNIQDGYSANGVLRAVKGSTGEPIFSVTDPAYATHPVSGIAAGDLTGNGTPELVTGKSGGGDLICFDASGQFLWQTEVGDLLLGWGAPAIANIDGEGLPEVVVGAAVFNADGSLRWRKTGSRGENYEPPSSARAPFSVPADVNNDGLLEIITGDTLYDHEGNVIWDTGYGDGFVAVADFNGGDTPEIVVVARGMVRLQGSVTGEIYWLRDEVFLNAMEACNPTCGMLGPPTVADFDGDGYPDIGVAGSGVYFVLNTYGSILWSVATEDSTSNITGSAVFDFDGDRRAEVVYADEISLKVFRGSDGHVLYEQPHSSVTACEYPVIADVDGDYNAEIILAQNDLIVDAPQKFKGIRVFGDAEDNWVNTRRIWNQHAYSVTNVMEDGRPIGTTRI